jgi:lipopolysaccharide transport system permease protein
MVNTILQNRDLIMALTMRDIASRYKGSYGGVLWYVIQNLLLLSLYTLVFGSLFKSRWNQADLGQANFALALFIGLIVFNLFAECITRAPGLILANANYVKKVIFPLQILPVVTLGSTLFNMVIALFVMLGMAVVLQVPLSLQGLWLPVILFPLVLFCLGLSWILAAVGTYVRDVSQVVSLITSALMFLSPLFYPLSSLPAGIQPFLVLNPLALPMNEARQAILFGQPPNLIAIGIYLFIACLFAGVGLFVFQRARKGFADVI